MKPTDWKELSDLLRSKGINVVAVDFPLSHRFIKPVVATDDITEAAVNGTCMMLLDVLAATAHVDYTKRHKRTVQGRAKRIEQDKGTLVLIQPFQACAAGPLVIFCNDGKIPGTRPLVNHNDHFHVQF